MKRIFVVSALVLGGMLLKAEGYQVNLQSQRQTGMGHTGTGLLLGSESMHFNPGALGFLSTKYNISGGVSGVLSNNTFQKESPSAYEAQTENPLGTPFYMYGATRISDKLVAGISVTTPYGNTLKWGDDWDGRYLIQDISLKAIYIQPTVSYKITDKIGLGVGFVAANGSFEINKAVPVYDQAGNEGQANLKGETWAYGYNVGITYLACDKVTLGLNYRSEINMNVDNGDAVFTVPSTLASSFPNTTFSAGLPMPSNLTFGLGYTVNEKWLLALDLQYVGWSAYETLAFDFETNTSSLADSDSPKDFNNSMMYRFGAEYTLNEAFKFRAGCYYDSTPIPEGRLSPETPGTNKTGVSAGMSWMVGTKLSVDASVLYIHGEKRVDGYEPANFYGTYYTNAVVPGIGLRYAF